MINMEENKLNPMGENNNIVTEGANTNVVTPPTMSTVENTVPVIEPVVPTVQAIDVVPVDQSVESVPVSPVVEPVIQTNQPVNSIPVVEEVQPAGTLDNEIKVSGTVSEEDINKVVSAPTVEVLDEYEIKKSASDEDARYKKNTMFIILIFALIIAFIIAMPYILKMIGF